MANANDVTITIFVNPTSLKYILYEFKIVENLGVESDYKIVNKDNIKYSESPTDGWLQINVPLELYITFIYYHQIS